MVLAFLVALSFPITGTVHLPSGVTEVASEFAFRRARTISRSSATELRLRASSNFRGRAILSCQGCQRIALRNLTIDGNRDALEKPTALPASNQTFAGVFPNNGILLEDANGISR